MPLEGEMLPSDNGNICNWPVKKRHPVKYLVLGTDQPVKSPALALIWQ